jgi:hypothetical protein
MAKYWINLLVRKDNAVIPAHHASDISAAGTLEMTLGSQKAHYSKAQ